MQRVILYRLRGEITIRKEAFLENSPQHSRNILINVMVSLMNTHSTAFWPKTSSNLELKKPIDSLRCKMRDWQK